MSRTHTHPQDYEKRYAIIPQAEPICPVCGGWYSMAEMKCLKCGYGVFVTVMEYDAADVRAMIATATADPRTAAQVEDDLFDAEVKQTQEWSRP